MASDGDAMARRPAAGSGAVSVGTGACGRSGVGAALDLRVARAGWDVASTCWRAYDQRMPWGSDPADSAWLHDHIEAAGARTVAVEADLSLVEAPARVFDGVETAVGPVTALVLAHTEGVDSDIMTRSEERRVGKECNCR